MMLIYRTYKYLIKPTIKQKEIIHQNLECCTVVYNKYLKENGHEKYSGCKAKEIMYKYKDEISYLKLADTSALMNLLFRLQDNRFNEKIKEKEKLLCSYTISNMNGRYGIYLVGEDYINIPKLGNVKTVIYRQLPKEANILSATIKIDKTKKYYVCISFSINKNKTIEKIDENKSIGLDYSSQNLYVDSNGKKNQMKHFYQMQEKRISKLKSASKKCEKGSNNYNRIKQKITKIYKRVSNQRLDYLHKLSTEIANNYDLVCVEDLDMVEIAKRFNLAKNTYDNSYSMFLDLLKYKLEERGKVLIKIDKYYPSSKRCNKCGFINNKLSLNERIWECPNCLSLLDRDINAAINIKEEGVKQFKSIGYLDNTYRIGSIPH